MSQPLGGRPTFSKSLFMVLDSLEFHDFPPGCQSSHKGVFEHGWLPASLAKGVHEQGSLFLHLAYFINFFFLVILFCIFSLQKYLSFQFLSLLFPLIQVVMIEETDMNDVQAIGWIGEQLNRRDMKK